MPPKSDEQLAEISVMIGQSNDAENRLLQNNKISEAIQLCVRMHRWERALDVAKSQKDNTDLSWVLQQRKKYLNAINRDEYLQPFKQIQ